MQDHPHQHAGPQDQPAEWGLSAWHAHDAARTDVSSWWLCTKVRIGLATGQLSRAAGHFSPLHLRPRPGQAAGRMGAQRAPGYGGERDDHSSWVAVCDRKWWDCDWILKGPTRRDLDRRRRRRRRRRSAGGATAERGGLAATSRVTCGRRRPRARFELHRRGHSAPAAIPPLVSSLTTLPRIKHSSAPNPCELAAAALSAAFAAARSAFMSSNWPGFEHASRTCLSLMIS